MGILYYRTIDGRTHLACAHADVLATVVLLLTFACQSKPRHTDPLPLLGDQDFQSIPQWTAACDRPLDLKLRCNTRTPRADCLVDLYRGTTLDHQACSYREVGDGGAQQVRAIDSPWDCEPDSYQVACRSLPGWEIDISPRGGMLELCINAPHGMVVDYAKQVLPTLVGWIRAPFLVGLLPTRHVQPYYVSNLGVHFYGRVLGFPHDRVCLSERCPFNIGRFCR